MHSAFLETPDGSWELTWNPDEVIEHNGDLLVNETMEDQEINTGEIESRTGKHATLLHGRKLVITDEKLYTNSDDAREAARATNAPVLAWSLYNFDNGFYETYYESDSKEQWEGFVAERVEGELYRLRFDPVEWERLNEAKQKRKRRQYLLSLKKEPRKVDTERVVNQICQAIGVLFPMNFRLDQTFIWIEIHDKVKGKRATNKFLRELALKWCNDREKSKAWLGRWARREGVVEALDERLAAVLRLGDRNSRHKPRKKAA